MLEDALFDLAEHLDHPAGAGLEAAVRQRIGEPEPVEPRSSSRARTFLAVAAAVVVIAGALVAIAPARRAIADWLGIGAVDIRRVETPLPNGPGTHTVPGAPSSSPRPAEVLELSDAQRVVQFTIAVPRAPSTGSLAGVEVDRRVIGGLVVLLYPRFTLVEIASSNGLAVVGKLVPPGVHVDPVTVGGDEGLWIAGVHQITYEDRSGHLQTDTVRRSGPVLVWVRGDVTYRIEGLDRAAAERIAASVR
jgi:hypothetical protein